MNKKLIALGSSISAFLTLAAGKVMAQTATPVSNAAVTIKINRPAELKIIDIGSLITSLISLFLFLAAFIAFIFLLWGGFQWITSGGDKGHVETARNRIQAALLGLLITFAAYALFRVVTQFLGIGDIFGGLSLPSAAGS